MIFKRKTASFEIHDFRRVYVRPKWPEIHQKISTMKIEKT